MKFDLFNTFVNISSEEEYIKTIFDTLQNNKKKTFFYLNSYSFYLLNKDISFAKAFNNADFIIPDGYSVILANKIINKTHISKVVFTYSFSKYLLNLFEKNKNRLFFLGATDETLIKCINKLKESHPLLQIVGYNQGYFDTLKESANLVKKINDSHAEILIVGMGMPKSELWIYENISSINVNCLFSVGGFYEFIAGNKKQAPNWMYNSGLEWVYRLGQEPKRLFKRYLYSNIYFINRIILFYLNKVV